MDCWEYGTWYPVRLDLQAGGMLLGLNETSGRVTFLYAGFGGNTIVQRSTFKPHTPGFYDGGPGLPHQLSKRGLVVFDDEPSRVGLYTFGWAVDALGVTFGRLTFRMFSEGVCITREPTTELTESNTSTVPCFYRSSRTW